VLFYIGSAYQLVIKADPKEYIIHISRTLSIMASLFNVVNLNSAVTAQQAAGKAKQEAMARSRLRERFLEVSVNDRILQ
jgi:hypothetical protein